MKTNQLLLCTLGLLALVTRSEASPLYGSTSAGGPGELWLLNPATGASLQDIGPLNDSLGANYAVTGLAFSPLSGVLYGSTGNTSGQKLLTINPSSGLVTVVGTFSAGVGNTMSDLAFNSSGQLFGISSSGGANLYSINLSSGVATKVGSSGVSFTAGGGLAISPTDNFYGTPTTSQFGTYDSSTGIYSNIANPDKPAGATASYAALAFDGTTLYGDNLGTPTHLVTIDTVTGAVTDIGPSVTRLDAIAFEPVIVPEPGTLALFSMAGGVLVLAAVRRKMKLTS